MCFKYSKLCKKHSKTIRLDLERTPKKMPLTPKKTSQFWMFTKHKWRSGLNTCQSCKIKPILIYSFTLLPLGKANFYTLTSISWRPMSLTTKRAYNFVNTYVDDSSKNKVETQAHFVVCMSFYYRGRYMSFKGRQITGKWLRNTCRN